MEREDWNERYRTAQLIWTAEPNRFLAEEAAGLSPGRALDLAAGEGRNAVWLAERGWTVRAVDFSDVALVKARQLARERGVAERVELQQADLRGYELGERVFDLVAVAYFQIPQAELAPILARAARAVSPGGTFLLVGHDSTNLVRGYGGPRSPDVLYTAEQVVAAIGGEIEIEKATTVDRPVRTDEGTRIAIDCLVRARRP